MARGRMLNKSVCASKKFNELSDDTCRLLATWTIANLDCYGVFYGDPAMVRSYVFPRRCDLSVEQIDGYLQELARAGLIVLFGVKGDTWQWWPGFADNQIGLRADRESTGFPPPPSTEPDGLRQDDGKMTDEWRQDDGEMPAEIKLSESNTSEVGSEGNSPPKPAEPTPAQSFFTVLAGVCQIGIDKALITKKQRGQLNAECKRLREAGIDEAGVQAFGKWWYAHHWRGKNQDPPVPSQIRSMWTQFKKWKPGGDGSRQDPRQAATQEAIRRFGEGAG